MTAVIHAAASTPGDTFCGDGFLFPYDGWREVTCRKCLLIAAAREPWFAAEPKRRLAELDRLEVAS